MFRALKNFEFWSLKMFTQSTIDANQAANMLLVQKTKFNNQQRQTCAHNSHNYEPYWLLVFKASALKVSFGRFLSSFWIEKSPNEFTDYKPSFVDFDFWIKLFSKSIDSLVTTFEEYSHRLPEIVAVMVEDTIQMGNYLLNLIRATATGSHKVNWYTLQMM